MQEVVASNLAGLFTRIYAGFVTKTGIIGVTRDIINPLMEISIEYADSTIDLNKDDNEALLKCRLMLMNNLIIIGESLADKAKDKFDEIEKEFEALNEQEENGSDNDIDETDEKVDNINSLITDFFDKFNNILNNNKSKR